MEKSYVTMVVCPMCKKETGDLYMDRKLRNKFERYTEAPEPCKECIKQCVLLYDKDTKKLRAWVKKEGILNAEAMEQYKDTPVRALAEFTADGFRIVNP